MRTSIVLGVAFALGCGSSSEQSDSGTPPDAGDEKADPADFLDKPLRDQVDAVRAGTLSSAGLEQGYAARVDSRDRIDGGTRAVLAVDPQAPASATAIDGKLDKTSLLLGAMILVKDNIDTQGLTTT